MGSLPSQVDALPSSYQTRFSIVEIISLSPTPYIPPYRDLGFSFHLPRSFPCGSNYCGREWPALVLRLGDFWEASLGSRVEGVGFRVEGLGFRGCVVDGRS